MADAIVQTIKIEVEGQDEAEAALKGVSESAARSFEETEKAAQTAGVSIEDFGKLSEKTQQAYVDLSKRVVDSSHDIVQSTQAVQEGAQNFGGGMDEVTKKSGISTREMRGLSKIMKEFGAGDLASTAFGFYRIATSLGALGVAAIVVAKAVHSLTDFIKEAIEAAKAIEAVSRAGGGSIESLTALERAFVSAGGKAKEFGKSMVEVLSNIEKEDFARNATPQMKELANNVGFVAFQLLRMGNGIKQFISPLTTVKTLSEAIGQALSNFSKGIVSPFIRTVPPDATKKLEDYVKLLAAMREQMTEAGKIDFDKALKMRGFDDATIKNIALGTRGLADLNARLAQAPSLSVQMTNSLVALGTAIGTQVGEGASAASEAYLRFLRDIPKNFIAALGQLPTGFQDLMRSIGEALASIGGRIRDATAGWFGTLSSGPTTKTGAWDWLLTEWNVAADSIQQSIARLTQLITDWVTTPVAGAWAWLVTEWDKAIDSILQSIARLKGMLGLGGGGETIRGALGGAGGGGAGGGFAGGGLLGGRGTGTSDSNLAWVSRGEHLMPARAVAQPGVLAFLEALRRSGGNLRAVLDGIGHFALGGLGGSMPMPAFAGGGGGVPRNLGRLELGLPGGGTVVAYTDEQAVDALRRAAAMSQIRSGGRKPSRYS